MDTWRLLDTGVRTAAENMALDEAILEARDASLIPNTVRFLRFWPEAVLIGYHQSVEQEVRLDYCLERGFEVNRRITGGGAIFFDKSSLGWELIASRRDLKVSVYLEGLFGQICSAVIFALKELGVDASFRPRNDIEVMGKKISGTGGTVGKEAFLFQGTLLVDFNIQDMLRSLKIPTEKLKDKEIDSFRERVTCLKWEIDETPPLSSIKGAIKRGFEKAFNIKLVEGGLTQCEEELYRSKLPKFRSDEWIHKVRNPIEEQGVLKSVHKVKGGLIRTSLVANRRTGRINSVMFTGDFFAFPQRAIPDLEVALKDTPLQPTSVVDRVEKFFRDNQVKIIDITPGDFISGILMAAEKMTYFDHGIDLSDVNSVFTVVTSLNQIASEGATLLLLPYCAKAVDCSLRHEKGCTSCGMCSVGEAWALAEEVGMAVETIVNYEDLEYTLTKYKLKGVPGFIGCCCEAFLAKHRDDFERIGMPGILVDIDNSTCYDLGKEKEAYKGKFDNQTHLKTSLLRKIVDLAAKPFRLSISL